VAPAAPGQRLPGERVLEPVAVGVSVWVVEGDQRVVGIDDVEFEELAGSLVLDTAASRRSASDSTAAATATETRFVSEFHSNLTSIPSLLR
jgi:hypothetical protein